MNDIVTIVKEESPSRYMVFCPGCKRAHVFDSRWTFNGDMEKPTFNPSYLIKTEYGDDKKEQVCHSYVRNGQWQFLNDCTHKLSGKTVDMEEIL